MECTFVALALSLCLVTTVFADTLQSTNYKLDESVIGVGDVNNSASQNYKAVNSTGDISIGDSASSAYQIEAGSKTNADPALTFSVDSATANFNGFSPTAAATATATFSIINYTSYGYAVQIMGSPPTLGGHMIAAMGSTGSSQTGIEQFGINLVANTLPTSFGANPSFGQFGFGSVDANYNTPNRFRYVNGETIASAPKSSGKTTYTISYLVNVSALTPAGQYTSNQTVVVTGTY